MEYIIVDKKTIAGEGLGLVRQGVERLVPYTQPVQKPYDTRNAVEAGTFITNDDVKLGLVNYGTSELGTEVYSQVTFGAKYSTVNSTDPNDLIAYTGTDGITYRLPKITFQAILVSVSFPRNIVKTEIQGRDGTVKEYIGEGDAQITFRGVITGKNGHYPKDEVALLKQLIKAPVSIPIVSDYLNNLDIYNVVFDDRSFEQEEGGYSYQAFSLNAISDAAVELHI